LVVVGKGYFNGLVGIGYVDALSAVVGKARVDGVLGRCGLAHTPQYKQEKQFLHNKDDLGYGVVSNKSTNALLSVARAKLNKKSQLIYNKANNWNF
jgi:hypothetical protein